MNLPSTITLRPPGQRAPRSARHRRVRKRPPRRTLVIAGVAVVLVVAAAALVLPQLGSDRPHSSSAQAAATSADRAFLDAYVVSDGRVVRRDQGGDTVSEGQAYAMLAAVAVGDRTRFNQVWRWTSKNLQRSDGLLSWHWQSGKVADTSSASDADLDAAWALALAAKTFDDQSLRASAKKLAGAILDHEVVSTDQGPVLTAGNWATTATPATGGFPVNPSYFSPGAYAALGELTGDARWSSVASSSRKILDRLTTGDRLPPDWARVSKKGDVAPTAGPAGSRSGGSAGAAYPLFGQDAARTPVRYAASCRADDRALAARAARHLLGRPEKDQRAEYDLAGSPQVGYDVPLERMAAAAAGMASGDHAAATAAVARADTLARASKTYYGSAWIALGRTLLQTDLLQSCSDAKGR